MASDDGAVAAAPTSGNRKEMAQVNVMLAMSVVSWLKKRGKAIRPKLSDEQKKQLHECFELMDADGSGAIDAEELGAAFKLLGLQVSQTEIKEMLDEVDRDGSGEVEYPEFLEIMTSTLAKLAERKETENKGGGQVPFALMATAYRRKRLMEGLISGDKEVQAQIAQMSDDASREQLQQQKEEARPKQDSMGASHSLRKGMLADQAANRWQGKSAYYRMHIQEIVEAMSPEERRIISGLFTADQPKQDKSRILNDQRPRATNDSKTKSSDWWKSPKHRALLEMPEVGMNLRFSKPTFNVFKGTQKASGRGGGAGAYSQHQQNDAYDYYTTHVTHPPLQTLHSSSSSRSSTMAPSAVRRARQVPAGHFLPEVVAASPKRADVNSAEHYSPFDSNLSDGLEARLLGHSGSERASEPIKLPPLPTSLPTSPHQSSSPSIFSIPEPEPPNFIQDQSYPMEEQYAEQDQDQDQDLQQYEEPPTPSDLPSQEILVPHPPPHPPPQLSSSTGGLLQRPASVPAAATRQVPELRKGPGSAPASQLHTVTDLPTVMEVSTEESAEVCGVAVPEADVGQVEEGADYMDGDIGVDGGADEGADVDMPLEADMDAAPAL